MNDLSAILITSPFASMPSLEIINIVIESLAFIDCTEINITILMDGVKVEESSRMKKGKITHDMLDKYNEYHEALMAAYGCQPRFEIHRSAEHKGFAAMVKWGLQLCQTKYALIMQHDRYFSTAFHRLFDLLQAFEQYPYIRYIGFPCLSNITHDRLLHSTYHLECLNRDPEIKLHLGQELYLQPLIFWFDSQHLVHVARALQILTMPIRSLPPILSELLPMSMKKPLVLKPGDFIEDRFGQGQRNLFIYVKEQLQLAATEEERIVKELFQYFGSYLVWDRSKIDHSSHGNLEESSRQQQRSSSSLLAYNVGLDMMLNKCQITPIVKHLHGRQWREEYPNGWKGRKIGFDHTIIGDDEEAAGEEGKGEEMAEEAEIAVVGAAGDDQENDGQIEELVAGDQVVEEEQVAKEEEEEDVQSSKKKQGLIGEDEEG